jgi:hypothetical protein
VALSGNSPSPNVEVTAMKGVADRGSVTSI